MYQAWPWGGTAAAAATASPTTAAFAQPAAAGQVPSATQWPAGYSQYAVTPEIQQQWAAWASQQAQYAAYTGALPVGQVPTTTTYATGYAGYETAPNSSNDSAAVDKSSQPANEKPKNPAEELVPKDNSELEKLNKLKEQAEQWKTLQQPAAAATWPYSTTTAAAPVNTTAVMTTDAALKSNVQPSTDVAESGTTQMDKEDEEFERQFKDWEKQFDAWKRENSNHPDKEAFARYEKQWQEWRTQLLQKKEQMQKAKASKLASQPATDVTVAPASVQPAMATMPVAMTTVTGVDLNNQTNVTTAADPATAAAPNMYYPPNQYMYMQPYMYPGGVPGAQTAVPPPPFTGQSIPSNFGAQTPANQSLANDQNAMNFNDPNMSMKGVQNFDQNRDAYNYSQRTNENNAEEFQNYEGYENPNMFPQEMDDYQREMKFGRGGRGARGARGMRGRGRARGRGGQSRWSDGPEIEQQPSGGRGQSLLPTPPLKFSAGSHDGRPPLLDNAPPPFDEGQPPFDDGQPQFGGRQPPFDMRPPFGGRQTFDERQPPFDKRPPIFEGEQPNFESGPPPFEGGQLPFEGGQPPFDGEQPPFEEGPPPYEYPPEDMGDFAPDKAAQRQNFKPEDNFSSQKGLQPYPDEFNEPFTNPYDERYPPGKDRFQSENEEFPPHDERFPPDGDGFPCEDERFPPGPGRFQGGPDRFPPGPEEFPQGPMDDRFMGGRDFDQFPPDNDMYGPPPFREEFPPFEDRYPPGRGRFPGRGRRMPRGEFDRFGPPPFQPGMGEEGFGPDFPPPDRFGFPGDGPPRMPRGRGMRQNFEPGFPGRGRFPDRFYGDGPRGRGGKTIDYTHRPASDVMGEDYNPHYDFESDFQNDVGQYRDNFSSDLYTTSLPPIIFSQVNVESFDYGHGMKPMTTATIEAKKNFKDEPAVPNKVFEYSHRRERSPLLCDRPFDEERNEERSFRDRDREPLRNRDRERNRDRDRDFEKERDRDREHRDNLRENRDKERDREREREKDREREFRRDRDRERDHHKEDKNNLLKHEKSQENGRNFAREKESSRKKEIDSKTAETHFKTQSNVFKNESSSETVLIDDLLVAPKRASRPKQLVIILRGLPGSGKTYVAKLIKDKEIENGGSAPRILSLDDYFMVESEVMETDPDTGKRIKKKEFKFEYEVEMEEAYRASLFKSFKKTIDDRFFPFIIVDAVHNKTKQYEQFWSYAKQRGFQVYIAEMDCSDPVTCHKRNIHNRNLEEITKILQSWEKKPRHFLAIDIRSLLQDVAITEVEMEVESNEPKEENEDDIDNEEESDAMLFHVPSRWEKLEATEEKLDKLDGLRVGKKKHSSMEDYLQLPDDYEERKCEPGKKRVRWADLEEKKEQDRLRAIGFVVGQTDWTKLTDPTHADRALTKTKYF